MKSNRKFYIINLFYLLIFLTLIVVSIERFITKFVSMPKKMTTGPVKLTQSLDTVKQTPVRLAMQLANSPLSSSGVTAKQLTIGQVNRVPSTNTMKKTPVQSVLNITNPSLQSSVSPWKVQYSYYINGVKASRENVYITEANYTSRQNPSYYSDTLGSLYQLTTYMSVGELARRYHARYIIDLGCGSGSKLAALQKEFHLIGIDYKLNLNIIQKVYPFIDVFDIDLDQGLSCQLKISPEILSQAVVLSADVIEHLVDPFNCYMKVLQELANQTLAVVVSTPDRHKLNAMYSPSSVMGPPFNDAHVREWLLEELEIMFMDHGLFPVSGGLECNHGAMCGDGYFPNTSTHTTAVLFFSNTQVRRTWLKPIKDGVVVQACVMIHQGINEKLLDFNLHYLQNQGIKVCLVAVEPWIDTKERNLPTLKAASGKDAAKVIEDFVNQSSLMPDDWIMVINANEIISFPNYTVWNHSLHEALIHIGHEPYGFNAVALSVLFMQGPDGQPYKDLPFKMFGLQPWTSGDEEALEDFKPTGDTLKLRTRIWKRGHSNLSIKLNMCNTSSNQFVPCDVDFTGKKNYPYHAQSLRFHPSFEKPYVQLSSDLRKMYVLEATFGYYESTRFKVMTAHYLY